MIKKQTIDIDSYIKTKNKNLNFREVFLETCGRIVLF
jgi:hypothetical protein